MSAIVLLHGGNVDRWMWADQIDALADHEVVAPDLPGFGARSQQTWHNLDATADDLALQIAEGPGRAHIVGMSLGGVVAIRLAARHPDVALSVLTTGAPFRRLSGPLRGAVRVQLALWDQRWAWVAQARAMRLPPESMTTFIDRGMAISRQTASRSVWESLDGTVPPGLRDYLGPVLAVAGTKEHRIARDSFEVLRRHVPQVRTALAPGMHHAWNAENPALFNLMVREWVESEAIAPGLMPSP